MDPSGAMGREVGDSGALSTHSIFSWGLGGCRFFFSARQVIYIHETRKFVYQMKSCCWSKVTKTYQKQYTMYTVNIYLVLKFWLVCCFSLQTFPTDSDLGTWKRSDRSPHDLIGYEGSLFPICKKIKSWWFRNPIPNQRLDVKNRSVYNGINYLQYQPGARFLNHQQYQGFFSQNFPKNIFFRTVPCHSHNLAGGPLGPFTPSNSVKRFLGPKHSQWEERYVSLLIYHKNR